MQSEQQDVGDKARDKRGGGDIGNCNFGAAKADSASLLGNGTQRKHNV